jgi:hypothetical protein
MSETPVRSIRGDGFPSAISALLERQDADRRRRRPTRAARILLRRGPGGASAAEPGAFEDVELRCLAEDPAGNLWIGTAGGGAVRIDREGFVRYGREDGLEATRTPSVFALADETPCVQQVRESHILLACFDGTRFHTFRPRLPRDDIGTGWGTGELALQDRKGRLAPDRRRIFDFPRGRIEPLELRRSGRSIVETRFRSTTSSSFRQATEISDLGRLPVRQPARAVER